MPGEDPRRGLLCPLGTVIFREVLFAALVLPYTLCPAPARARRAAVRAHDY